MSTKQPLKSFNIMNLIYRYLIMLTMGPNSAQQCMICCIPETHLDAIDVTFSCHNTLICRETYEMALLAPTEAEANHICKAYSMCKVKVCPGPHGLLYNIFLTE